MQGELGFLLWESVNHWQRKMTEHLKPLGITHVQYLLLSGVSELQKKHEAVTQVHLAGVLRIDTMMTSKVCRTLQRKGLILRANHRFDTRAKALVITKAGLATVENAGNVIRQVNDVFFQGVDHAALKTLLSQLLGLQAPKDQLINATL